MVTAEAILIHGTYLASEHVYRRPADRRLLRWSRRFNTHWSTDGRRDVADTTAPRARRYAVEVDSAQAAESAQVLDRA